MAHLIESVWWAYFAALSASFIYAAFRRSKYITIDFELIDSPAVNRKGAVFAVANLAVSTLTFSEAPDFFPDWEKQLMVTKQRIKTKSVFMVELWGLVYLCD